MIKLYNSLDIYKEIDDIITELKSYRNVVYCIKNNINNKCYVGSSKNIINRMIGVRYGHLNPYKLTNRPTKLNIDLSKYGLENFSVIILENKDTYKEAEDLEYYYIKEFDSYLDGYNLSVDGKGCIGVSTKDKTWITDGTNDYLVFTNDVDSILSSEKYSGRLFIGRVKEYFKKGKIMMHLEDKIIIVDPTEEDDYLNLGYLRGFPDSSSCRNRLHVNNGRDHKMIKPSELDEYINKGYVLGKLGNTTGDKIWINKDGKSTLVDKNEFDYYINTLGYSKGRTKKIWVTNGVSDKGIYPNEFPKYESLGFRRGRSNGKRNSKILTSTTIP